jgi:hypothetical protein
MIIIKGDSNDSIVVRLLSWPTKEQFDQKIHEADILEGDAYERKAVEVHVEDKNWEPIPSGDWLRRHFK